RTVARSRLVESLGSVVPVQLHVPLHRDHRHAECLHDLLGFYCPTGDHLAGEHAETLHVSLCMLEHWQVAVNVPYRARVLLHRDSAVDLRHPSREYRQLQLRHPSHLSLLPSAPQIHFWLILFSLTVRNYWARSGVLKLPAILREFTGIEITQSALTQDALKTSEGVVGDAYQELRAGVATAPAVYTDDTGWRIHGQTAHLMTF